MWHSASSLCFLSNSFCRPERRPTGFWRHVRIFEISARRLGDGHCGLDASAPPNGAQTGSARLQTASKFSVLRVGARLALYNLPTLLICVALFLYIGRAEEMRTSLSELVQVVGSESMRPTIGAIAEDFMTRNPLADITVRGGGSGDGIAALLHGMVDIAMTSRDVTPGERAYVSDRGLELSIAPLALRRCNCHQSGESHHGSRRRANPRHLCRQDPEVERATRRRDRNRASCPCSRLWNRIFVW